MEKHVKAPLAMNSLYIGYFNSAFCQNAEMFMTLKILRERAIGFLVSILPMQEIEKSDQ